MESYTGTLVSIGRCKKKLNGVMGSHMEVIKRGKMAKIAFFMKKPHF